jgi:hypothetical protein
MLAVAVAKAAGYRLSQKLVDRVRPSYLKPHGTGPLLTGEGTNITH